MGLIKNIKFDLDRLKNEYHVGKITAILSNRGFHALLCYRLSNSLNKSRIPVMPLILTRLVQIFYGIDIDYKAQIDGGIVILHGVGLVIGQGAIIKSNCTFYHGVTLGRKMQGFHIPANDGYPTINSNCLIGAGAKIIGPIEIGANTIIGPNCVVTKAIPADAIVKMETPLITLRSKIADPSFSMLT